MSIIVLSLLLLILVGLGGLMGKQISAAAEYFDNPPPATDSQKVVIDVSPALANLLDTPRLVAAAEAQPTPQVDVLQRDLSTLNNSEKKQCPKCPDMSQYVRLDEVPCWNCTLP
jgi:hypothetical protein